MELEVEEDRAT
ncbi:hypothetical protein CP09DC78_0701A, partial [Chlamydia psittaci 09DC78]